jgi:multidrug efflux pump subunit AcrA (membrane-fusion protein)
VNIDQAQAQYEAANANFNKVAERIDNIEQFADREAELRADEQYENAEARLKAAIDDLHAAGGMTFEEVERSAPPSERYAVCSLGDQFGLGESFEVYEVATGKHVYALSSREKAEAYIAKGDERWNRRYKKGEQHA